MSADDPTHGHTPPDDVDEVVAGVGTRLAEWTIALRDGRDPTLADPSDPIAQRELRRVRLAVAKLAAAARPTDGDADS